MDISFVLHHYIPQHNAQIWDETSKTRINFSILRNTRLWVFDFSLVHDHATPLLFKAGEFALNTKGDLPSSCRQSKTLLLFSELTYLTSYIYCAWLRKSVRNVTWIPRFSSILTSAKTVSTIRFF